MSNIYFESFAKDLAASAKGGIFPLKEIARPIGISDPNAVAIEQVGNLAGINSLYAQLKERAFFAFEKVRKSAPEVSFTFHEGFVADLKRV